jgi:hypothetical protein
MTQKHKSIVDRVHLPVAQLGQIGLKSTLMPEYFSIRGAGSQIQEHHESHSCNAKIKKPVQTDLWTGFRIFQRRVPSEKYENEKNTPPI